MLKVLCAGIILTGSLASFAQTATTESITPPLKAVENSDEFKLHVGLNAGVNIPEGNRNDTGELGLDVGYQPYIPFGLGAEVSTSRFRSDDDESHKRTTLLARGTYNFGGDVAILNKSYVGLAAGPVFLHDGTELGVAPLMGFDYLLGEETRKTISVGLNVKYLVVTDDPDSLIATAAMKYWF